MAVFGQHRCQTTLLLVQSQIGGWVDPNMDITTYFEDGLNSTTLNTENLKYICLKNHHLFESWKSWNDVEIVGRSDDACCEYIG